MGTGTRQMIEGWPPLGVALGRAKERTASPNSGRDADVRATNRWNDGIA